VNMSLENRNRRISCRIFTLLRLADRVVNKCRYSALSGLGKLG